MMGLAGGCATGAHRTRYMETELYTPQPSTGACASKLGACLSLLRKLLAPHALAALHRAAAEAYDALAARTRPCWAPRARRVRQGKPLRRRPALAPPRATRAHWRPRRPRRARARRCPLPAPGAVRLLVRRRRLSLVPCLVCIRLRACGLRARRASCESYPVAPAPCSPAPCSTAGAARGVQGMRKSFDWRSTRRACGRHARRDRQWRGSVRAATAARGAGAQSGHRVWAAPPPYLQEHPYPCRRRQQHRWRSARGARHAQELQLPRHRARLRQARPARLSVARLCPHGDSCTQCGRAVSASRSGCASAIPAVAPSALLVSAVRHCSRSARGPQQNSAAVVSCDLSRRTSPSPR